MKARRYWDSSVFIAWLLPEENRKAQCQQVLREAKRGEIVIVTSAITLTEVIKLKGHPPIGEEQEDKIRKFFLHEYFVVAAVDRAIGELARKLIWRHGLKPKDSIHVATAIHLKIPVIHTFDLKDMGPLDGKVGTPPVKVMEPTVPQPDLPFGDTGGPTESDELDVDLAGGGEPN